MRYLIFTILIMINLKSLSSFTHSLVKNRFQRYPTSAKSRYLLHRIHLNPISYNFVSSKAISSEPPKIRMTKKSTSSLKVTVSKDPILAGYQEAPDNTPIIDASKRLYDHVTVVRDNQTAQYVLSVLKSDKNIIWACDTEVADIDVSSQSPVGNGFVTCISIYGGPNVDFGKGPGGVLWIDNMDDAEGIASEFKEWFESHDYKKVWHNYGFDRHVMYNIGIDCQGFAGDTMHMARAWDSSLDKIDGGGGYSLEALSESLLQDPMFTKTSMKELFGVGKLKKDGTESKIKELPPVRDIQRNPHTRERWIEYSALDAIATWHVYDKLRQRLIHIPWMVDYNTRIGNMMDYINTYLVDFGNLLTDMERNGIMVDTKVHLKEAEFRAREERSQMEKIFLSWAEQICPDAKYINPSSSAQIQQLFFGHYDEYNELVKTRVFQMDKEEEILIVEQTAALEMNPYLNHTAIELKEVLKSRGLKLSGTKAELVARLIDYDKKPLSFDMMDLSSLQGICISRGLSHDGDKDALVKRLTSDADYMLQYNDIAATEAHTINTSKVKKYRDITIESLCMAPLSKTPKGQPQVSAAILKKMAGQKLFGDGYHHIESEVVLGTAKSFFGDGEKGREACRAIGALAAIGQIDATITNFLVPLQALVDKESRIHCSLNLNTETGRLSSRRPNLQNQPALEKDQYKIRDAFIAAPGNTLIVADYGQLELRLLAHITSCQSMLEAFQQGGCFHSRTAVGMYPYIKDAVSSGKVLLEWDYSKGQPTVPLVKDTYGSERRKAKTLNFSIAYGKTVHGLAEDWGISKEEAEETLNAWYKDRPEVKTWQEKTKEEAKRLGYVRTLMGRYRILRDAKTSNNPSKLAQAHSLRAAINTPIQGSAADIVIMAMIKLWKNEVLKKLGWKLLLQIHDEVILEGPKESVDEAMKQVRASMENPFDGFGLTSLQVHLDVDAKSADSWYKAK